MRIILVTIAWLIGTCLLWSGICNLIGFCAMYLVNERQWHFPDYSSDVLNYTSIAGGLLIPVVVVLMGMRRKLPGIRPRTAPRGFPVESS
jgi:hypothetical protein